MRGLRRIIITAAVVAVAFGTVFAPAARASCGSWDDKGGASWQLKPSSGRPGDFGVIRLAAFEPDGSIVGMWRVDFTPDGADQPIDSAVAQWHSDGTEIMNSSRDPRTSSFCLGVWKRTGPLTFALKHLAMSWDGAGNPIGPATILETVTLDRHANSFSGRFVLTQYALDGVTPIFGTPITGSISGTRITPD